MIGKLFNALLAQINKLINFFWMGDPIAQMQLEYDRAVEQIKEGRSGLEQYRALVERVNRQVILSQRQEQELVAKIRAYVSSGDRETAGKLAIELQKARADLATHQEQQQLHEMSYQNNVEKIKHAAAQLTKVKEKIKKYQAELKMSGAEAEIAKLTEKFNFNVTTDFGELEAVIHEKIDLNRAKVRVSADMSGQGIEQIEAEKRMEKAMAEEMLREFEVEAGLLTVETIDVHPSEKRLGSALVS